MLIVWFLSIKSLPNLLFGVLCLPGDQSHPFAQPTINPLACCICWAGLLGRAVFPPWNEGQNFGSYTVSLSSFLLEYHWFIWGFPGGTTGKESACQCRRQTQEMWVGSLGREDPWRRKWQPIPVFLPKKFHGQRSLTGYSSKDPKESDMTEHTYTHSWLIMVY